MREVGTAGPTTGTATREVGARLRLQGEPYALIPLSTILDRRMTPSALGILNYLIARASIPGGWTFYTSEIASHFDVGQSGSMVRRCLRELETLGYIRRERVRDRQGRLTGQDMAVSATPIHSTSVKKGVQEESESTSRFSSCGSASRGKPNATQRDTTQREIKTPMPAVAGDVRKDRRAETGGVTSLDTRHASVDARKQEKASLDPQPFLDIWNAERNPDRMAGHRVLDSAALQALHEMVHGAPAQNGRVAHPGHSGDVEAALESWRLVVRKLASVDTRDPRSWWGQGSVRRPLVSAARNWGTHAIEINVNEAAPAVTAPVTSFTLREDQL